MTHKVDNSSLFDCTTKVKSNNYSDIVLSIVFDFFLRISETIERQEFGFSFIDEQTQTIDKRDFRFFSSLFFWRQTSFAQIAVGTRTSSDERNTNRNFFFSSKNCVKSRTRKKYWQVSERKSKVAQSSFWFFFLPFDSVESFEFCLRSTAALSIISVFFFVVDLLRQIFSYFLFIKCSVIECVVLERYNCNKRLFLQKTIQSHRRKQFFLSCGLSCVRNMNR